MDRGEQVFTLSFTESLMPSIGSPVPAPSVLAVIHCPLQAQVQNVGKGKEGTPTLQISLIPLPGSSPAPTGLIDSPRSKRLPSTLSASAEEEVLLEATFVCVTGDGKLWQWIVGSQVKLDANEPVFKVK